MKQYTNVVLTVQSVASTGASATSATSDYVTLVDNLSATLFRGGIVLFVRQGAGRA